MISLSDDRKADIIKTFSSTSRCLSNIVNPYFEGTTDKTQKNKTELNLSGVTKSNSSVVTTFNLSGRYLMNFYSIKFQIYSQ